MKSTWVTLLMAIGALQAVVAGDSSPGMSAAARVHRLRTSDVRIDGVTDQLIGWNEGEPDAGAR